MIILSGGIDLSVGSVLALSGAVAAGLLKNGIALSHWNVALQFTVFGAIVAGIAVGLAAGWINGFVITRLRVPPFVATLGMLSIARGLTQLWTRQLSDHQPRRRIPIHGHRLLAGRADARVDLRGAGVGIRVRHAPHAVRSISLRHRRKRAGRHAERPQRSIGSSEACTCSAARLAGVGGLLLAARLDAADPKVGIGYELDSIAAVVIGGTSLSGGRGSILGTVLGCLIIGVLNNGLVLLGVSPDWQLVVKGIVIIVTVAVDRASSTKD